LILEEEDYLEHYGILRRSGRYPWGSSGWGKGPQVSEDYNKRNKIFLDFIKDLKKQGLSEKQIAQGLGASINELRAAQSSASNQERQANIAEVQRLKDKGYSPAAISERMGIPDSTVRSYLEPGAADNANVLHQTADMLKKQVAEKQFIDVGKGVENYVGVSATRLANAVGICREEGYELHQVKVPTTSGHETTMKVLAPPGTTWGEVQKNRANIQQIASFSEDGGRTYTKTPYEYKSLDPKRLDVRYREDGGAQADGLIYIRPDVKDIHLGGKNYGQVRIKVGDSHYLKGMAMYKEDLPAGVEIQFNTSKSKHESSNKLDALKPLTEDMDLPFKALVRPIVEVGKDGKQNITSVVNIVSGKPEDPESGNVEGNWREWSRNLSSQMLSKQSPALAKQQLDMTHELRKQRFEDIMNLTNPTVRKKLLEDFAGATDSAAVHLKAAALPGQSVHVLLPIENIHPGEIFAPRYANGERVVLIRHPHGGTFEIPELTVNNRNAEGLKLIGNKSMDAVGIHHTVAQRLSGADFDGDTVVVIPNTGKKVKHTPALEELKGFDPQSAYPGYEGMRPMRNTQAEMGSISNLITDMTIKKASTSEIARAIKHSMVVIDAEKKNLNHRLSYNDNNIKDLKEKYQRQPDGSAGASTLLSRARSRLYVPHRKERTMKRGGPVNPLTGRKEYEPTGKTSYITGKPRTTKTTRLAEAIDAFTLSSGTPMEALYAVHSNRLKALANEARLAALNTPRAKRSPSAAQAYQSEVASLNSKLADAQRNAPLERQAQIFANTAMKAKRQYNPDMDKKTAKKVKYQELNKARERTGAGKQRIRITSNEWDAIQAGAISDSKLSEILRHADMNVVRDLATPKEAKLMTPTKTKRAKQWLDMGYTRAEVAEKLGVSLTTLDTATK
jgi:hypothetical protein